MATLVFAGLFIAPTGRTLRRWLSEEETPSRANRERIARAYEGLRTDRVDRARHRSSVMVVLVSGDPRRRVARAGPARSDAIAHFKTLTR